MVTTNFAKALDEWRAHGGAMLHEGVGPHSSRPTWEVNEYDAIQEKITRSVRGATIAALRAGGLSEEQIAGEMKHWSN